MPKSQYIDPKKVRAAGEVILGKIEMNQYKKTFAEEKKLYSKEDMLGIYNDMEYIREFETMLFQVRTQKHYNGVDYLYTGPAHLYVGQEAEAVGMAWNLTKDDVIFGSHRSHGEVLAKGFNAIRNLPEKELMEIMKSFLTDVKVGRTGVEVVNTVVVLLGTDLEEHGLKLTDVLHVVVDAQHIFLAEKFLFFSEGFLVLVHFDLAENDFTGFSDLLGVDVLTFRHFLFSLFYVKYCDLFYV